MLEGKESISPNEGNIFLGFTKNKYMTIFTDFGRNLIGEFPVRDCWVTQIAVKSNLLFIGTSKGSIRVYPWPIR